MEEDLTADQVRHVALLASLDLSDSEVTVYQTQLASILDYAERLALVAQPIDDLDPGLPHHSSNTLRQDVSEPSLSKERALSGAPSVEDGQFKVPRIGQSGSGQ